MTERIEAIRNVVTAVTAGTVASAPAVTQPFYETPIWMSTAAVLAMGVLILTAINTIWQTRKIFKGEVKDESKAKP